MKLKKFHLYNVLWIDAYSSNSWTDINDVDREIKRAEEQPETSVGFYIKTTPKFYIFTTGHSYDKETLFNYFSIPKSWIINLKEIKL